jgi:CheY-like chemotaxis protein
MMGGELHVTSMLGKGTAATLSLPVAAAPPQSASLPAAEASRPARVGATLSVLYAEDNEVNAELLRQIVTLRPSVSLRVAESGMRALEMAQSDPPDLMLVDMNLGDMSGLELARALNEQRATREIRLVALSADALPEQIDVAMRSGFEAYLTKPINFSELLRLLDAHLRDA